ncbi:chlorohydrolase family protein [Niveomyces insectorum RCEF 264]|uniref:Chlorohydrolase family protein n=1 Tax=Niveomyces insectorum RCEF 264 TaxID=1081102 RepID=A0A167PRN4_9HYPO|nr:chlorohydrolase family protein [Niveomyces insectorum RCEF 264]
MAKQVFFGTLVHTPALNEIEYLHNTAAAVDETGTIVALESLPSEDSSDGDGSGDGSGAVQTPRRDGPAWIRATLLPRLGWAADDVAITAIRSGQFFFPGFIDTHLHASQYPNVGLFGKTTLLDWLTTYTFPLEASLADLAKARRVYRRCVRTTLAHGTTTAAYYATVDVAATNLLADLCLAAGQRALVGRTILAHAVHLTAAEAALVRRRGSKVSHCPCSNSAITSGAARVRWLLDQQIDVGLGTDMSGERAGGGAAGQPHTETDDRAKLSVEEVLYLATAGGARVVGLADRVGRFAVGLAWDAQLIGLTTVDAEGGTGRADDDGGEDNNDDETTNVDIFGWETWSERVAKWLFNGDDRNTKKVWVNGRLVHDRAAPGGVPV